MFSVIIPLYNKAHTIGRCLDSVLAQTCGDFEIVIVNDGSTDDSEQVVREHSQDARIVIHSQANGGVSAARNAGVAIATHDYVAFLDADDEWHPDFLATMKRAVEQFPEAGLLGSGSIHRNWNETAGQDWTIGRYRGKILAVDYFQNPHTMPHTSAMVASRKAFQRAFPDGEGFPVGAKLCEDWSCFYRLAARAPFVYVGFPLGYRNNGVPGQITGVSAEERRKLLKHNVDFYNRMDADPQVTKQKAYRQFVAYDLRGGILMFLRGKDYDLLAWYLDAVKNVARKHLNPVDLVLSRIPLLRLPVIAYLYATKVRWRWLGYPVVGKFQ